MTPADVIEVIAAGMCHDGEKRDACATCQRKLLAIEAVRRMEAVVEAARERHGCDGSCLGPAPHRACTCGHAEMVDALDALDELAGGDSAPDPRRGGA